MYYGLEMSNLLQESCCVLVLVFLQTKFRKGWESRAACWPQSHKELGQDNGRASVEIILDILKAVLDNGFDIHRASELADVQDCVEAHHCGQVFENSLRRSALRRS